MQAGHMGGCARLQQVTNLIDDATSRVSESELRPVCVCVCVCVGCEE